jgi:hypothetical protein
VAEATLQSVRSVGVELNRGGRDESRFCGNDMLGQVMAQASTRIKATNKAPSVVSSQLVTLHRSIGKLIDSTDGLTISQAVSFATVATHKVTEAISQAQALVFSAVAAHLKSISAAFSEKVTLTAGKLSLKTLTMVQAETVR